MIAAARDYEASRREAEHPYEEWPIIVHPTQVERLRMTYKGELNVQFTTTPKLAIEIPVPPPGQYRYAVTVESLPLTHEEWIPL